MTAALTLKKKPRYIKVPELKALGYELTKKQIQLGTEKPCKYGILEVKNEDNRREVGFCVLFSTRSMQGIILPHSFHFYEMHPVKNFKAFVEERGLI